MVVDRIRHGVVVTADVHENRPKMKLDNNRVFGSAISFPDGLSDVEGWPDDEVVDGETPAKKLE